MLKEISMDTVICPQCKNEIVISQLLKQQIEEDILKKENQKHKEQLEKARIETEKKIKEEINFKLKDNQNEIEEAKRKNQKLEEQLLEMNKYLRELKSKQEMAEIEMQKQINLQREKIQEEVSKTINEKAILEKAELQKQLDDTKKALADAQRKAEQTSQQLRGEVLELDLEQKLHDNFPTDEIIPVPKGIDGADICHKVCNKHGQAAGIIIWETKRTKAWSNSWLSKLRDDKRQMNASMAILVSDILPNDIKTFGFYENVWISCYKYAIPLANVLRMTLFEIAIAKSTTSNKDEKMEALFAYFTQDSFRNRLEAQVESIVSMKEDLELEQRSMIRSWKKREMQIKRLMGNVATMYGELQGIIGSSLPTIHNLDAGHIASDSKKTLLED